MIGYRTLAIPALILAGAAAAAIAAPAARAAEGPKLTPYGFIRLDAIFDDSRMSDPQYPFWVSSEPASKRNDKELDMHPRLTRLGMKLSPYDVGHGVSASGIVEVDFQNGGKESREILRMRHAFVQFAKGSWELLAGQTWDLISPLYPAANNDGMMWNAGNTGDRRPQARFTLHPSGGGSRIALMVGMPNAVNNQDLDQNGQLDGLDAAVPVVQALVEARGSRVLAGVWGHVAVDRVAVHGHERNFTGALLGGHLRAEASKRVALQGEAYWGQNADDVRAGIGQGINLAAGNGKVVRTVGGWAEVAVKASDLYDVTVGATVDDPDRHDLAAGGRRLNQATYLVQHFHPWDRTTFGVEYLHWITRYLDAPDGIANRIDAFASYSF